MSFDATHVAGVLDLLSQGLTGLRGKQSQQQIDRYRTERWFIPVLHHILVSPTPVGNINPQIDWALFREIAAITIKNNIASAARAQGEGVLVPVAQVAAQILTTSDSRSMVSAAAQIVAKVTSLTSVPWWQTSAGVNLPDLLLTQMLRSGNPRLCANGLQVIEYLLDDAATALGDSCKVVIDAVADLCAGGLPTVELQRKACGTLIFPYENGSRFDWNVDKLLPYQYGLIASTVKMVQTVTGVMTVPGVDNQVAQMCLRGCSLSIDYASYFDTPSTQAYMEAARSWCAGIVHFSSRNHELPELAGEAFDLCTAMLVNDERNGCQDYLGFVAAITASLPQLMPLLFDSTVMRDAEVAQMMEHDHVSDRTQNRRGHAPKRVGEESDDAVISGTLRDAAGRLMERLAVSLPEALFPHVLNFAQLHFQSGNWKIKEVVIMTIGSVALGCWRQLASYLASFIPTMAGIATGEQEKVAVRSISLWALSRCAKWLFDPEPQHPFISGVIQATLACLSSTSKRVQWAAITSLRDILRNGLGDGGAVLAPYLPVCFASITAVLPTYHTLSLQVLCDLMCDLVTLMNEATIAGAVSPFQQDHDRRLALLGQTFNQHYVQHQHQVDVDQDVFEIARVVSTSMSMFPNAFGEGILAMLNVYVNVMQTFDTVDTSDDADLTAYPLHIATTLVQCLTTQQFGAFVTQSNSYLAQAAVKGLKSLDIYGVSSACAYFVHHFRLLRTHGVGGGSGFIIDGLVPLLNFSQYPLFCCEAAAALHRLLEAYLADEGQCPAADAVAPLLMAQVRGDTFENEAMNRFAVSCGCLLKLRPQHANVATLTELNVALRVVFNSEAKAEATKGVSLAITNNAFAVAAPQALQALVESYVRLLLSWQSAATEHEGLCQSVNHALTYLFSTPVGPHTQAFMQRQGAKSFATLRTQFIGS